MAAKKPAKKAAKPASKAAKKLVKKSVAKALTRKARRLRAKRKKQWFEEEKCERLPQRESIETF